MYIYIYYIYICTFALDDFGGFYPKACLPQPQCIKQTVGHGKEPLFGNEVGRWWTLMLLENSEKKGNPVQGRGKGTQEQNGPQMNQPGVQIERCSSPK